jgi:DNA-binding MarR family transcriptional regulator
MSILDKITGNKPKTAGSTVLVLTPLGRIKAEKFDLPGAKWRVLSILNENGPSTLHELSEETGMDEAKIKSICKALLTEGYIKRAEAGGGA